MCSRWLPLLSKQATSTSLSLSQRTLRALADLALGAKSRSSGQSLAMSLPIRASPPWAMIVSLVWSSVIVWQPVGFWRHH